MPADALKEVRESFEVFDKFACKHDVEPLVQVQILGVALTNVVTLAADSANCGIIQVHAYQLRRHARQLSMHPVGSPER